ncbi:initiator tRNA phosphoribosyl transferase [Hysterangium stoloniferum]|nr:initiator tRNA phosphoribosyl transferase [Hysterangium stoloniferum]
MQSYSVSSNEPSLIPESKNARKEIRQESNDTYNRLHSISEDAAFISRVANLYPNFKVFPNLRCGAWYVDPKIVSLPTSSSKFDEPVYFKSTDGHFGQWSFNLRRANLHLLRAMDQCEGIILVDSTRHGKRFPDALSKTIPIWCAVINMATAKASSQSPLSMDYKDNHRLYTPPGSVSRSEHTQIEARLHEWSDQLITSEFSLPSLRKPLRPIWFTPSSDTLPPLDSLDFTPVVCISASKLVSEGLERRSAGFTYVQGSGDDHESWSRGLTPEMFWKNKEHLLSLSRSTLLEEISALLEAESPMDGPAGAVVPVLHIRERLAIGTLSALTPELLVDGRAYVILATDISTIRPTTSDAILCLQVPAGKKGQLQFLTDVVPKSLQFLKYHLTSNKDAVVLCGDGKDMSVGVVLVAICSFFDDDGVFMSSNDANNARQFTFNFNT